MKQDNGTAWTDCIAGSLVQAGTSPLGTSIFRIEAGEIHIESWPNVRSNDNIDVYDAAVSSILRKGPISEPIASFNESKIKEGH